MTEFIVSGPSTPERLESAGMEVIVRCKDCEYSHSDATLCSRPEEVDNGYWMFINSDGYCAWGIKRTKNG